MSDGRIIDWIHDDITWCVDNDCSVNGCMRNPKNIHDKSVPHSYAMFRGTDECPVWRMETYTKWKDDGE